MTFEQWLIVVMSVINAGLVGLLAFLSYAPHRQLMHFHNAGRSMAQHELEKAKLEIDKTRAEAELKQAEANAARAKADATRANTPRRDPLSKLSGENVQIN